MNPFKRLRVFLRVSRRVGAFKSALKAGMSPQEARKHSDALYPPTPEEITWEENRRREELRDEVFKLAKRLASDDKIDLSSSSKEEQMQYVERAAAALGVKLT